jgi:hypothetical protein
MGLSEVIMSCICTLDVGVLRVSVVVMKCRSLSQVLSAADCSSVSEGKRVYEVSLSAEELVCSSMRLSRLTLKQQGTKTFKIFMMDCEIVGLRDDSMFV